MKRVILASSSLRRKELLESMGLNFVVELSSYEEDMGIESDPVELVKKLAYGKAEAVARNHMDTVVIGADTIVVCDAKVHCRKLHL